MVVQNRNDLLFSETLLFITLAFYQGPDSNYRSRKFLVAGHSPERHRKIDMN